MRHIIRTGIISKINGEAGIGSQDFDKIFKDLLFTYKVPYVDKCCPQLDHVSTMFFDTNINKPVRLIDKDKNLYAAIPQSITKYSQTFGDGNALTYTITHNLNDADVIVQIRDVVTGNIVDTQIVIADANTIIITTDIAPTTNQYKAVIIK